MYNVLPIPLLGDNHKQTNQGTIQANQRHIFHFRVVPLPKFWSTAKVHGSETCITQNWTKLTSKLENQDSMMKTHSNRPADPVHQEFYPQLAEYVLLTSL